MDELTHLGADLSPVDPVGGCGSIASFFKGAANGFVKGEPSGATVSFGGGGCLKKDTPISDGWSFPSVRFQMLPSKTHSLVASPPIVLVYVWFLHVSP